MSFAKYKNYNFSLIFKENLLAFLLLFLGTFYAFSQIKFGTNSFGDLRDGRFSNFILEHFYRALTGEEKSFKNANFFSQGMVFCLEILIKSKMLNAKVTEIPITLFKDGRKNTRSHLRTISDGLKTLKFILYHFSFRSM